MDRTTDNYTELLLIRQTRVGRNKMHRSPRRLFCTRFVVMNDVRIKKKLKYTPMSYVKFMLSKKATKIGEIFTVDLTLCGNSEIS